MVAPRKSHRCGLALKRCIDVVGAAVGLVALLPIFAIAARLVKIGSPGSIIFRQTRMGRAGRPFTLFKFRTMDEGCDDTAHRRHMEEVMAGRATGKVRNDSRITRTGRWLRKFGIDQLPQLINVLRGEMSLVGPRASVPYEYEMYDVWHRWRLIDMKPGLTGLSQVQLGSSTGFEETATIDIHYTDHWSLWLDLKILAKTPLVVVTGENKQV